MNKHQEADTVAFVLYEGDIWLVKDKLVRLTKGYNIPYFKKTKTTKDRIYFKYDNNRFYYDRKEEIIYFTKYKGGKYDL
jgi:hypothetical protein